jgi:hypothetical protein
MVRAIQAWLGRGGGSRSTRIQDEALALPTEEAARLCLRTQQTPENRRHNTVRPVVVLGAIALTDEIEKQTSSISTKSIVRREWSPYRVRMVQASSVKQPTNMCALIESGGTHLLARNNFELAKKNQSNS